MKRNIIQEEIYSFDFKDNYDVRFKDIPKDVQENDIIAIQNEEAYHSESWSYDAYTRLIIIREREENDTEYNKRMAKIKKDDVEYKEKRYQNYLKLKEEFEPKQ